MKKLIAVILILAMVLPAAALADFGYIEKHYALHAMITDMENKGEDMANNSITIDLFIYSDGETVYYMESRVVAGVFLCNGMIRMKMEKLGDDLYIYDSSGNYRLLKEAEGTMMIDFGRGYQPMQLVEMIDIY